MKSPCAVNLHNAVTVPQQRLGKRVAQLSSARMNEVSAALRFSLGLRFQTGYRERSVCLKFPPGTTIRRVAHSSPVLA
jgi:PemK-like, MazF-like toxin of type II toxin-antitoxin system